jgi:uncharacterized protein (TIGR04141 family)
MAEAGDQRQRIPLTCFRLHSVLEGKPVDDFDDFIDVESDGIRQEDGPVAGPDFEAKIYVLTTAPRAPGWAAFVAQGFDRMNVPISASTGALLIVHLLNEDDGYFAFTFGVMGRHLLRDDAPRRAYGLRTALNLIYPHGGDSGRGRVTAVDTTRRAAGVVRARRQANRATNFEAFEVDRLRDVMTAATGPPVDDVSWGTRVSGGDAINFSSDTEFNQLGVLCRAVDATSRRTDYRERFRWLDQVNPITDPFLVRRLEDDVAERLRMRRDIEGFDLAPPEILDWARVDAFRYHFDGRRKVKRPDLRLSDLLTGLEGEGQRELLSAAFLRSKRISALDGGGHLVGSWSVWRCLSGEIKIGDETYILDEGGFFAVDDKFLLTLNGSIDEIPRSRLALPVAAAGMREGPYNEAAAKALGESALLLDRVIVHSEERTTGIEICDILTTSGELVHVKRHLGSSDLSHLFSQGFVSAESLQNDRNFRVATQRAISTQGGGDQFQLFSGHLHPQNFEVVYAVIAKWHQRGLAAALPFFSKVNLRRTVQDLTNRGFRVSFAPVDTE